MAPAESIRELVIQDLEAAIGAIDATASGGTLYHSTIAGVVRYLDYEADHPTPVAMVTGLSSTEDDSTHQIQDITMRYRVDVALEVKDATNIQRDLSRLADDVRRAILVDPKRGGYAIDTHILSTDYLYPVDDGPYAGAVIEGTVLYRHRWGDPYTTWDPTLTP